MCDLNLLRQVETIELKVTLLLWKVVLVGVVVVVVLEVFFFYQRKKGSLGP